MAKPTYRLEEIEQQLAESRRELRAADATIHNLELKLADMAAHLDNEESKCVALAAENAGLKSKGREVLNEACKVYEKLNATISSDSGDFIDGQTLHEFQFLLDVETPATDAYLAEVRDQGLNTFIQHHSAELDAHIKNGGEQFDEKSVRIRDIIVSARLFREQIRQEAAQ